MEDGRVADQPEFVALTGGACDHVFFYLLQSGEKTLRRLAPVEPSSAAISRQRLS